MLYFVNIEDSYLYLSPETTFADILNNNVAAGVEILPFQKTWMDEIILNGYTTYFNPLSLKVQFKENFIWRQNLTEKIKEHILYSVKLSDVEMQDLFLIHAIMEPHRSKIKSLLQEMKMYLIEYPDDTTVHLLMAYLYFRIGDLDFLKHHFKLIFKEIDHVLLPICENAFNYTISDATDFALTESQKIKYTILVDAQSPDCSNLKKFRTLLIDELTQYLFIASRDSSDSKRKNNLMFEAFALFDSNYRLITSLGLNSSLIMLSPNSNRGDQYLSPSFQIKSLLRHHMHLYQHLYNKTILFCDTGGSEAFRDSVISQHGSCDSAEKKFLHLFNSYRNALYMSSPVISDSDDRDSPSDVLGQLNQGLKVENELGLREGSSRAVRDSKVTTTDQAHVSFLSRN